MKIIALLLAFFSTAALAEGPFLWGPSDTAKNLQSNAQTKRLKLLETGGTTDTVTVQPPANIAASYTLTLPVDDGTASQVLSTDGSGILSWLTTGAIGSTVSGGTTGSVLFVGAGPVLAQDNANFFWDDTNNFLGIGTAAPGDTLDVIGGARASGNITIRNGNWNAVFWNENLNSSYMLQRGASPNTLLAVKDAADIPLAVRGFTSQTADLQQWQNITPTAVASMSAAGAMTAQSALLKGLAGASQAQPTLGLTEDPDTGTDAISIQAPASLAAAYTLTLPVDDGTSGQILSTDGSGVLSWLTPATSAASYSITGATGSGFEDFNGQGTDPASPATNHMRLFGYGVSSFGLLDEFGHHALLDLGNLTADRTFQFPDVAGVFTTQSDNLSVFASTTSAQLAGVLSNETGTGQAVFSVSPILTTPNLGTPTALTLTAATGLPLTSGVTGTLPVVNGGTGITSLGTGIATWLGTPSSANLISAMTDETGTGALVFANTPTLIAPLLGTPTSGVMSNVTGLPLTTGVTGTLPVGNGGTGITSLGTGVATFLGTPSSANFAAAVTGETGTGAVVFDTSPTLTTPTLGVATATSVTWSDTTKGIIGTVTNDDAAAGYVGQIIESITTAANVGTSAQYFNATSITLTAGDWDVFGAIEYTANGATFTSTDLLIGISGTTGNSATGLVYPTTMLEANTVVPITFTGYPMTIGPVRVQSNGTNLYIPGSTVNSVQVLYLKGYVSVYTSGAPQYRSYLKARRVR